MKSKRFRNILRSGWISKLLYIETSTKGIHLKVITFPEMTHPCLEVADSSYNA